MSMNPGYYGSVPQNLPYTTLGAALDANYQDSGSGLVNQAPEAAQVYTITVASAAVGRVVTVTIGGSTTVSYTEASTTTADEAIGLAAALTADFNAAQFYTYAAVGSTVVCTAQYGVDESMSVTGTGLSVAETTAPGVADPIPFARGVINLQTFTSSGAALCSIASSANLVAQVDSITVVYASGETYDITVTVGGVPYAAATVTAATNLATLVAALASAVNAVMPANTVIASTATGTVILTAEIAGLAFNVAVLAQTRANMSITHTTSGPLTNINACFAGVSMANYSQPGDVVGVPQAAYPGNSVVTAMHFGKIAVYSEETVTTSNDVYVETSGTDIGKFFTTGSATRLKLTAARWIPHPGFSSVNINGLSLAY